jgi:ubiquinone biosynthesis protein COQ9
MIEPEIAAVIDALLPQIPFEGWTYKALRSALVSIGQHPDDAKLLFPNGPGEMIETFCTLADERMAAAAAEANLASYRLPARVRAIILLRLEQNRGNKEAIRRALAWLALPTHAGLAAKVTARTVDAIWFASGDISADFSWYTKRGILAAVYSATLLFWLHDTSPEDEASLAFLDRRLAGVKNIGSVRKRVEGKLASWRGRFKGWARRGA